MFLKVYCDFLDHANVGENGKYCSVWFILFFNLPKYYL